MGQASAGFTDLPREHIPRAEADPGWGRNVGKTQGGILDRFKRRTLCGTWPATVFSIGGSRCSHLESRVLKRKVLC